MIIINIIFIIIIIIIIMIKMAMVWVIGARWQCHASTLITN